MYKYRRHLLVIPLGAVRHVWAFLFPIVLAIGQDKGSRFDILIEIGILAVVFLLVIGYEWLKWRSFTYEWDEQEVRVEKGIWTKTKTIVPTSAIAGCDQGANLVMKAFGVVTLKLETAAGGAEADVELACIPEQLAAQWLTQEERASSGYRLTLGQLLLYGTSSPATLVAVGAITGFLADAWTPERIPGNPSWWADHPLFLTAGIIAVMIVVWLFASLVAASKYYNFSLKRDGSTVTVSRGLWKEQTTRFQVQQVQAVEFIQHPFHALFGYESVRVHVTSSKGEDGSFDNVLFPLVRGHEIPGWFLEYLPEYTPSIPQTKLPKQIQHIYIVRPLLFSALSLFLLLWKFWLAPVLLLVLSFAFMLGKWQGKTAAWGVTDHCIALTHRAISKRIKIVPISNVQSIKIIASPFGRRGGYCRLYVFHVSGPIGDVAELPYVPKDMAEHIISAYEERRSAIRKMKTGS